MLRRVMVILLPSSYVEHVVSTIQDTALRQHPTPPRVTPFGPLALSIFASVL